MIRLRRGPLLRALLPGLACALLVAGCSDSGRSPQTSPDVGGCGTGTTVSDAAELTEAMADAEPGDVLMLAPGRYGGHFTIDTSGTSAQPITLCGSRSSVLDGGAVDHGYTLHLDGASYWRLRGFSVTGGQKGVLLDGSSHNEIVRLRITDTGDEALHLRAASSHNLVAKNDVSGTGLREPAYGEGIYVGTAESNWCDVSDCEPDRSDDNRIVDNTVADTSAEAVDIKEGTTGGELRGNELGGPTSDEADSVVDLKGNDWLVTGNRIRTQGPDGIQVHVILEGWGRANRIMGNSFTLTQPGYAVHLVGAAEEADNVVSCRQRITPTDLGEPTNVPCR
ncbi:MAG: hypothetical protein JWN91_3429 [Nocardioides sp.]|nr:hypothetical protein [Nocardioides sp.]